MFVGEYSARNGPAMTHTGDYGDVEACCLNFFFVLTGSMRRFDSGGFDAKIRGAAVLVRSKNGPRFSMGWWPRLWKCTQPVDGRKRNAEQSGQRLRFQVGRSFSGPQQGAVYRNGRRFRPRSTRRDESFPHFLSLWTWQMAGKKCGQSCLLFFLIEWC